MLNESHSPEYKNIKNKMEETEIRNDIFSRARYAKKKTLKTSLGTVLSYTIGFV
jgi:hypothetical protein